MKKISFLLVILLVLLPCLYGYDDDDFFDENEPFRIKDRKFEIGFGIGGSVSNNLLSLGDIFSNTIIFDLNKLELGLKANAGLNVPFYFDLFFDTWGIGMFANIDATGALALNGKMLSFQNAVNEKSDLTSAVFFSTGVNSHFHIQQFKVRFKPALFYPILYVVPETFSYTFDAPDGLTRLVFGYELLVYTISPGYDISNINTSPGFDFSVGVEYPVTRWKDISPLLDFDIGLDLVNIPIVASVMNDYFIMSGGLNVVQDPDDELTELFDALSNFESDTSDYLTKSRRVDRPFKMFFWAAWRPLAGSELLTVTPMLGFALNDMYHQPLSIETGINAKLNLANMFLAKAGLNYTDRLYKNSLGVAFNCRVFQMDVDAEFQSQDFLASWTAKGFGLSIGFKFGF